MTPEDLQVVGGVGASRLVVVFFLCRFNVEN